MSHPPADPISRALESLFGRFQDMVRAVGRRHGLTDTDMDEVMQETRIRLWRARPDSAQLAALPSSYVYRTARSAVLDIVRARRAKREAAAPLDESSGPSLVAGERADEALETNELAARVRRAVDALGRPRRLAVRLFLVGYDREEIARLLGWSEAKTRNLLYRGLADLRAALAREGIVREAQP